MSLKAFLSSGDLPKAANNVLGDLKTKTSEAAAKIKDTFSNKVGDFKKLAGIAPSFDTTAAEQAFKRAAVVAAAPAGTQMSEVDRLIEEMSPTPWEGHEVDQALADQAAIDALQQDQVSASAINQAKAQTEIGTDHMVSLEEKGVTDVLFRVMPEVVESRTVEYEAIAPPQFPSAFQKYKGTSSTQWSVNATLTCRTTDEATENLRIINVLRGWTVPFFGSKTLEQFPQKLGAPPPVLTFAGWRAQMVGPVQVVITSLNWNFPQDVDYIPANEFTVAKGQRGVYEYQTTGRLIPFPTVIKLAIQLVESFSTEQMNGFSVADFRAGQFADAFKPLGRVVTEIQIARPQTEAQTVPNPATRVGTERGRGTNTTPTPVTPPTVTRGGVVSEADSVGYISPEEPLTNRTGGYGGGDPGVP